MSKINIENLTELFYTEIYILFFFPKSFLIFFCLYSTQVGSTIRLFVFTSSIFSNSTQTHIYSNNIHPLLLWSTPPIVPFYSFFTTIFLTISSSFVLFWYVQTMSICSLMFPSRPCLLFLNFYIYLFITLSNLVTPQIPPYQFHFCEFIYFFLFLNQCPTLRSIQQCWSHNIFIKLFFYL